MNTRIKYLLLSLLLFSLGLSGQTTLSHNIGNNVIPNSMYSCSWGGLCWARKFILADFDIGPNQSFTITKAEVGLFYDINWDTNLQFNIYAIDSGFPASFTDSGLIGSSQVVPIQPGISTNQIIAVNFTNPVTVPAGTGMILVEVFQLNSLNSEAHAFVAATASDNDFSWFRSKNPGCPPLVYTTTADLNRPDAKWYITVSGVASALSVIENDSATGEFLYPNPVKDELFFNTRENVQKIAVFDLSGRLVMTTDVCDNKVNLERLPSGNYVLDVYSNGGHRSVKIVRN